MSCIVYKEGKAERVKAEFVEHMLRHGYTATKDGKPKVSKSEPTLQSDLAMDEVKNSKKAAKRASSNADKNKG